MNSFVRLMSGCLSPFVAGVRPSENSRSGSVCCSSVSHFVVSFAFGQAPDLKFPVVLSPGRRLAGPAAGSNPVAFLRKLSLLAGIFDFTLSFRPQQKKKKNNRRSSRFTHTDRHPMSVWWSANLPLKMNKFQFGSFQRKLSIEKKKYFFFLILIRFLFLKKKRWPEALPPLVRMNRPIECKSLARQPKLRSLIIKHFPRQNDGRHLKLAVNGSNSPHCQVEIQLFKLAGH